MKQIAGCRDEHDASAEKTHSMAHAIRWVNLVPCDCASRPHRMGIRGRRGPTDRTKSANSRETLRHQLCASLRAKAINSNTSRRRGGYPQAAARIQRNVEVDGVGHSIVGGATPATPCLLPPPRVAILVPAAAPSANRY